jgi:hypothetical protein
LGLELASRQHPGADARVHAGAAVRHPPPHAYPAPDPYPAPGTYPSPSAAPARPPADAGRQAGAGPAPGHAVATPGHRALLLAICCMSLFIYRANFKSGQRRADDGRSFHGLSARSCWLLKLA